MVSLGPSVPSGSASGTSSSGITKGTTTTTKSSSILLPRAPISPFITVRPSMEMNTPFKFPKSVEGITSSSQHLEQATIPVLSPSIEGGTGDSTSGGAGSGSGDAIPSDSIGRMVKNIDLKQQLNSASSTAGVLEAIKEADWKHYSVDLQSITWVRHNNGTLCELGHGAFSKVFKVLLHDTIELAAKIIPLEDDKAEKVFLRETITLFHLRHANITQFSGVCIHNRQGFLLMELMEGGSLFDCMGWKGSDGDRIVGWHQEGRRISLGIAQALNYLHNLDLVHMDIKSANVLLTRDFTPKLADVGFTRVWASMELSAKDSRIGTFAYVSDFGLPGLI